jgi:uncharacterized protein YjbJ (UPF0337 family)
MNKLKVKGDWNITKGNLKEKWASLTDNDVLVAAGAEKELIGRIQKRTSETREVVEKTIREALSFVAIKLSAQGSEVLRKGLAS